MRLDTESGAFTAHFHFPLYYPGRRRVVATLHRGPCVERMTTGANELGLPCRADSPAVAEITNPKTRQFRRDRARAEVLAKCMKRLGLNREERVHLWRAYFAQVDVLLRVCIGVETRCPAGHRYVVRALDVEDLEPHLRAAVPPAPPHVVYFPSAREFCGAMAHDGIACEQLTIEAKHRYLYRAVLPEGRRERRRRQAHAIGDNTIP